jgi:hypothetical protein
MSSEIPEELYWSKSGHLRKKGTLEPVGKREGPPQVVVITGKCAKCDFDETLSKIIQITYATFADGSDNLETFAIPNAINTVEGTLKTELANNHVLLNNCRFHLLYYDGQGKNI